MPNIKNLRFGPLRLTISRSLIYGLIVLLIIFGFLLFHHANKTKEIRSKVESSFKQYTEQYLNSHDYKSYQLQLTEYADSYTTQKEYGAAESALNEIIANVPSDKTISDTYRSFWFLYQQKGDTKNRKKYALLTAEKLKQEGQPQAAAGFEKDANGG